ncbi:Putative 2-hydroxyacid dehydrogenase YoaD [Aquimixticola soesokkakensis]|uniref:Putative 2-hydroxyacid dehydrogenase YoaD n=1 Tax=Aquimixticola soesokkakensis TaxID=1519096 RepID=A0A1Y5TKY4_9RHOB|nr:D-2-hydroxyacid dehydrogenase family protein [Aquimixticola soesokkakensis]SLN66381.1 Putative 2-hydroxyacid dehydrogenase YoaD [Aquimixticola soesokkakensis]
MQIHILDDTSDTLRSLPSFAKLAGHDVTVWTDTLHDEDALAARLQAAQGLVLFRERTQITDSLLARLPNLRLISGRGAWPHVDVAACRRRGITFCSLKSDAAPNHSAAELTWALVMAAMRDLPAQMAALKAGRWQAGVGRGLRGRCIGLYGGGRIAGLVAGYARAFGMDVIWWGSETTRARLRALGETVPESRAAFFGGADVISVHVRLVADTRGCITGDDFAAMRAGAVFVNTARAGLVERGALLAGLERGKPACAALDVFDVEPLTDPHDALLSHPNVIATPHIGFVTQDEFDLQFGDIYDQITAFVAGDPINVVT